MSFEILFTEDAVLDLRDLRKRDQAIVVAGIERLLKGQPTTESKNRKPLRPNDLSSWEVRLGKFRVFYDVCFDTQSVTVKAVGWKAHSRLSIRGKEFRL